MARLTAEQKQASTRSKLVTAATNTFLARGYLAASLDEISESAGYSTGAVYSNFTNKESLFLAAMAEVTNVQRQAWDEFLAGARELGVDAGALGKTLAAVLPESRWVRAVIEFQISSISELSRQSILASRGLWRSTVLALLRSACASNGWTPRVSVDDVADAVVGLVDGLTFDALLDPTIDIAGVVTTTVRLLLDGRATPDPA